MTDPLRKKVTVRVEVSALRQMETAQAERRHVGVLQLSDRLGGDSASLSRKNKLHQDAIETPNP